MGELQDYYDACKTGFWANPDCRRCGCKGRGYWLSDLDTWHECPYHFSGQPHPNDDYVRIMNKRRIIAKDHKTQDDATCPSCGTEEGNINCPTCNPPMQQQEQASSNDEPIPPPPTAAADRDEIPF